MPPSIFIGAVAHPNPRTLLQRRGNNLLVRVTASPINRPGYFICIKYDIGDQYSYWIPTTNQHITHPQTIYINNQYKLGGIQSWRQQDTYVYPHQVWEIPSAWIMQSLIRMPLPSGVQYPSVDNVFLSQNIIPHCQNALDSLLLPAIFYPPFL